VKWLPFIASAAFVSLALHLTIHDPLAGVAIAATAVLVLLPQWFARRRVRRLLMGGNVDAILAAWAGSVDRVPHPETMGPLLRATALAAHGQVDAARACMTRAARGAAWSYAIEQRLFIETLLDAFEGDREQALLKARSLEALPLPAANPFVRARIAALRGAMVAFARAFARTPEPADLGTLKHAARSNPLVHWPMRYAAAIVCIERRKPADARQLLAGAPEWPKTSVYGAFHTELLSLSAGPAASGSD
jgi:hypothetical protein